MRRLFRWIIQHKKTILVLFLVAAAVSAILFTKVAVNYKLTDYLPGDAPSTVGLRLMEEEFDSEPSNLRILLPGASIPQVLAAKAQIAQVPGLHDVTWLDDSEDITTPLEMMDPDTVKAWYNEGGALITAYVDEAHDRAALNAVRQIIGEDAAMAGEVVQSVETRRRAMSDIAKMLLIAVPIIFVILLFSTTSYLEPALFLLTIGVAIILGKGSDLLLGQISFITSACSAILQLATSMDYAIFLLESFEEYRAQGLAVEDAMVEAMNRAFSSILSSSLTTVFGFLALTLMQFQIGYDMGLVLAKGIVLSLICVLVLLPVLTVMLDRVLERSHHRKFLPVMTRFGRVNARICIPVMLLIGALVVLPCYLANSRNHFLYGTTKMLTDPSIRVVQDEEKIDALYEKANQMVLMVPAGDPARQQLLVKELEELDCVTGVTAYATAADTTIPIDFVGRDNLTLLMGRHYDRMLITANTETESDQAYQLVEQIRAAAQAYYPGDNYLTGGTSNIYDMRDVVIQDDVIVNGLSMAAIGLILLLNFKSLILPFILLSAIKASIYVNLAFPYFMNEPLYYLSLLIINAVQLGATVDYAILFTDRYMENRRLMTRLEATAKTVSGTFPSILTSAAILATGGAMLGAMSSVDIISQLGFLVGRGAVISAAMVVLVLPALLMILDPLIRLTTIKTGFYREKRRPKGWAKEAIRDEALDAEYRLFVGGTDGERPCDGAEQE